MKLIDLRLQQEVKVTLKGYLVRARTQTASHPVETWDRIAHDIWNITGESVVRETVINYARKFKIEPLRPLTQPEADAAEREDEEEAESPLVAATG